MTAEDLRAELARRQLKLYEIAPAVGLHPTRLGMILNQRLPLSRDLAERIMKAIQEQAIRASSK